jgi:hypothetical protein
MFHVIRLDTGKPLERDGSPMEYASGQEAAQAAREATDATGIKHQPRRVVVNVDWRARERERMGNGTYLPIPDCWSRHSWWREATCDHEEYDGAKNCFVEVPPRLPDHFAHPSTAKDGMIAFTESGEHGAQDRQTRLSPGRYLTRYFSEQLLASEIAHYAALYAAHFEDIELKVTQDADEVERVYTDGPRSCMSHSAGHYSGPCHPSRVYAGPDLAVAYIETSAVISARVVCWPENKVYSRIYGDETRLERLLEAAGYRPGDLDGARIRKIRADGYRYVMPYIDDCDRAEVDGKYIKLGYGDLDCKRTDGISGEIYSWHCDHCRNGYTDDDCTTEVNARRGTEIWCECCAENDAFYCDGTREYYSSHHHDSYRMANGQTWCSAYFSGHGATCDATGEHLPIDDTVALEDGTVWSADHFASHGHTCHHCGCLYDKDDIQCDCAEEEENAEAQEDDAEEYRSHFSTVGHRPRQGRDECDGQCELDLARVYPGKALVLAACTGDYVAFIQDRECDWSGLGGRVVDVDDSGDGMRLRVDVFNCGHHWIRDKWVALVMRADEAIAA